MLSVRSSFPLPDPPQLAGKYQSFTEADVTRLREAGYEAAFMDVAAGVGAYVKHLLGTPVAAGAGAR